MSNFNNIKGKYICQEGIDALTRYSSDLRKTRSDLSDCVEKLKSVYNSVADGLGEDVSESAKALIDRISKASDEVLVNVENLEKRLGETATRIQEFLNIKPE